MIELPFQVGALYHRRDQIHGVLNGQQRGGICTPKGRPIVIVFTGDAGKAHGYFDEWDEQDGTLHYYGEGQTGDMTHTGGNRAIRDHVTEGKKLLLFKMMGRGKLYRYEGEFQCVGWYFKPDTPARGGPNRTAIVFRLAPIGGSAFFLSTDDPEQSLPIDLGSTVKEKLVRVRRKQALFRRRLVDVEKGCRLSGVQDLRFLRASHIKPWSACATGKERTDGHNGLLLAPHADHLFDRGWISFEPNGRLMVAQTLPSNVPECIGLNLKAGRSCGSFSDRQKEYLDFHRQHVFEKRNQAANDVLDELAANLAIGV